MDHGQRTATSARAWADELRAAWREGNRQPIDTWLADAGPDRSVALLALAGAELALRIDAGEEARAEEYLSRFPELSQRPAAVLELALQEFSALKLREPSLDLAAYAERFPEAKDDLERLAAAGSTVVLLGESSTPGTAPTVADLGDDTPGNRREGDGLGRRLSVGRFQLLKEVGSGSFGRVYKAEDTLLGRFVAIKLPRAGEFGTRDEEDRFVREARSMAKLDHPGIVPVYEVNRTEDGLPYIVAEFVDGWTLAEILERESFAPNEAAEVALQIAEALKHAHAQGVIHRDLKPHNVMLQAPGSTDGAPARRRSTGSSTNVQARASHIGGRAQTYRARVMDFGLARIEGLESAMTREGDVLGTLAYMSPEQAAGRSHMVDGRSDVYSLGVILFELLTGDRPFRGNKQVLLEQVLNQDPPRPTRLNRSVPADLETICLRCLEKSPARRYSGAAEVADELERYLSGRPIVARPISSAARVWRWARRRPAAASALGLAVALIATLAVSLVVIYQAKSRAESSRLLAEQKEATSRRTLDFLRRLLKSSDPVTGAAIGWRRNQDDAEVPLAAVLKRATPTLIAEASEGDAAIGIEILCIIGDVYRSLGLYDDAESLLSRAAKLAAGEEVGPLPRSTVHYCWGWLHHDIGRYETAEKEYQHALSLRRQTLGEQHLSVAEVQFNMAWLLADRRRYDEAIDMFKQVLETQRTILKNDRRPEVQLTAMALKLLLISRQRKDDALKVELTVGPGPREVLKLVGDISTAQRNRVQRNYKEALPAYLRMLNYAERTMTPQHPALIFLRIDLAGLYKEMGQREKAEQQMRIALADAEPLLKGNPKMAEPLGEFARALAEQGELEEAIILYGRAIDLVDSNPGLKENLERQLVELERRQRENGDEQPDATPAQGNDSSSPPDMVESAR